MGGMGKSVLKSLGGREGLIGIGVTVGLAILRYFLTRQGRVSPDYLKDNSFIPKDGSSPLIESTAWPCRRDPL